MTRPALRLVDEHGELQEPQTPEETIRALQTALGRAERVITGLKAQLAANRKNHPARAFVESVIEEWQRKANKPRSKLTDDRFDGIVKMHEAGYTREHFSLMLDGLSAFPYVVYGNRRNSGATDSLKVDIAYVCEKGRRFEELVNLGWEAARADVS